MLKTKEIPWEKYAERQILEAQKRGDFDNLPGLGQPIEDSYLNNPWISSWFKRNNIKLDMEQARAFIHHIKD